MATNASISKTLYCFGVQCPKLMWLKKYHPELFVESGMGEAAQDEGREVGDLAKGLFGDFSEVKKDDLSKMVQETTALISEGEKIIAEASFSVDGLFCSVDILKNLGNKIVEIYEVKSSTSVKDNYFHDVAFQVYVLEKCGFRVNKACVVYINNTYKRGKELELDKLFAVEDITDSVHLMQQEVQENIRSLLPCISNPEEPDFDPKPQCLSPDPCGYWQHCSDALPKHNVFEIAGMNKKTMCMYYHEGIVSFEDLIEKANLNQNQEQQIRFELENCDDYIETDEIKKFLSSLTYPLYFLDFESFRPAVPPYEDSWPYEQIPFQYSLHIIEKEGEKEYHLEHLAEPGADPRRKLAEQLCHDIPLNVCTLAYNMSFEKSRIKELADLYPDLEEHLLNIRDNIHDLMTPFQSRQYYTKAMQGSYSINMVYVQARTFV